MYHLVRNALTHYHRLRHEARRQSAQHGLVRAQKNLAPQLRRQGCNKRGVIHVGSARGICRRRARGFPPATVAGLLRGFGGRTKTAPKMKKETNGNGTGNGMELVKGVIGKRITRTGIQHDAGRATETEPKRNREWVSWDMEHGTGEKNPKRSSKRYGIRNCINGGNGIRNGDGTERAKGTGKISP